MVSKSWKTFQIIQFVFFLCVSVFLFTRTVDGHGAVQTLEVKLISFAVWGIFYLGVLAIEWLIYLIVQHTKNKTFMFCNKHTKGHRTWSSQKSISG